MAPPTDSVGVLTIDQGLLKKFNDEIKSKSPYVQLSNGPRVVNPTPLVDLTDALLECARNQYGIELQHGNSKIYGKFDSEIFGGSVKVRPAIEIIGQAIATGKLRHDQTIFEATSGNFGIALGLLGGLGLNVVALVSRRLQDGVLEE